MIKRVLLISGSSFIKTDFRRNNPIPPYVYDDESTNDNVDIITPSRIVSRTRGSESSPEPEDAIKSGSAEQSIALQLPANPERQGGSTHSSELVQKTKCKFLNSASRQFLLM